MPVLRSVLLIAAPALTALIGLLWFTRRKKDPSIDHNKPPDKSEQKPCVIEQEDKPVVQLTASATPKSSESTQLRVEREEAICPQRSKTVSFNVPAEMTSADVTTEQPETTKMEAAKKPIEEAIEPIMEAIADMKIKKSDYSEPPSEPKPTSYNNNFGKSTADDEKDERHTVGPQGDHSVPEHEQTVVNGNEEVSVEVSGNVNTQSSLPQDSTNVLVRSETVESVSVETDSTSPVSSGSSSLDSPDSANSQDTVVECESYAAAQRDTKSNQTAQENAETTANCDTTTTDDSKSKNSSGEEVEEKAPSVEGEVSEMTSRSESSNSSSSNSKVASPISTPESDDHSEMSADSGKGPSIGELTSPINGEQQNEEPKHNGVSTYEFHFPTDLCGLLIGKHGKHINVIKEQSGARITVKRIPYIDEFQSVYVEGAQDQVDKAISVLKKRFPSSRFPHVDFSSTGPLAASGPVLQPEMMQLNLPEGVSIDVIVSSVVAPNHLFIQQPTHPTFPMLERMNQCMNLCYMQEGIVPELPRPIEIGVICAAPMYNGWYRSQVVAYHPETDECEIRYVDYGGYLKIEGHLLRQIRSDFTTLPFQAVECYLANVIPPKDMDTFPEEAHALLETTVQNKLMQVEVMGHEQDGVPYVQLYEMQGEQVALMNRELVDQGLAQWLEQA